ncbi:MAG: TraR/DksA family transcriptional regulator [Elusimicrobiota bacterium]
MKKKSETKVEPIGNIDGYREKLEEMRDDLIKTLKKKKDEAFTDEGVGDEADVAVRSVQRDLVFGQTDNEQRLLDEVEAALRRIEKGTYSICEGNGEKIPVLRLKAMPYARYCIKCQSRFEHL